MAPEGKVLARETDAQYSTRTRAQAAVIGFRRLMTKFRTGLHFAAVVVALILAHPTDLTNVWGLGPILAGLVLRTWALGHLRRDTELCASGPYAYVRHPLYLGSFIILMGYCIMANNLYLVAAAAIVTTGIYALTVRIEEQSLAAAFPEQYESYRQAVPALLPRFTPSPAAVATPTMVVAPPPSSQKFSWQLACKNQVVLMWVTVLLVAMLFEVKEDILEYLFGIEYSIIWPL